VTLAPAEAIFLALAGIDPAERSTFLDQRCGSDAQLRQDVESLVAALDAPDEDFLDPRLIPTLDMAAADGPLQPGERLGEFLVLRALGSGGMGVVYAAQQERPRRTVAIKVLRRGYRHPEMLRRFEHEAEMLGRLQHPGIAQVYAFYAGDRTTPAHLVMELVAGPPLTDYARAERLSLDGRVRLIVGLADAVQHAHERGVIHRDLKPANVLVADGRPKVLDFGIARATRADVQRLTMHTAHGQLMGTLAFMSPEQLRGRSDEIDERSDVYALGVLLYRLAAERLPFDVGALSWVEALQRVLESEPVPLGAVNPELAGPLQDIAARAMARNARQRYQSAADLASDLRRFLDGHGPSVMHPRPVASSGAPPGAWTVDGARVRTLAQTADGRHLVSGGADGAVRVWDVNDGRLVATLQQRDCGVTTVAALADGRIAIAWDDGRLEAVNVPPAVRD
jgi:serine/threonine protein kinase